MSNVELRYFVGILLPVPIATLFLGPVLGDYKVVLVLGYIIVGIPSILFAWVVNFILKGSEGCFDYAIVLFAGIMMGLLAGVFAFIFIQYFVMLAIGAGVGLIVSTLMLVLYHIEKNNEYTDDYL